MDTVCRKPFTHLHVHSHYSLLDSTCGVVELVDRTKALAMDSVALTDHGRLHGAIEFYTAAREKGIRPIIGMEAGVAAGDGKARSSGEGAHHLLLLAENAQGYQNLVKLSSIGFLEGPCGTPQITNEALREHSEGLICTSACLRGKVASLLMARHPKLAREAAELYAGIFGSDRFFLEVHTSGVKGQHRVNAQLVDLARRLGVGVVATNDVHFLGRDDYFARNMLWCVSTGKTPGHRDRPRCSREQYLKSPDEMWAACGKWPQALENTQRIADMCNLELDLGKRFAPAFRIAQSGEPDGTPAAARLAEDERHLRHLCEEGLRRRYGTANVGAEVRARLERELKTLAERGLCSTFLIAWDFCRWARVQSIPLGAYGRSIGVMVSYLLGLSNVDPLKYGLLFERFMEANDSGIPDLAFDICRVGAPRVVEYIRQKYGHVAQIATFARLSARDAYRGAARVMKLPQGDVDRIARLIGRETIAHAIKSVPELARVYQDDANQARAMDVTRMLEGLVRVCACDVAGIAIADRPLDTLLPLCRDATGQNVMTQYERSAVDKVGVLRMSRLRSKTVSARQRAIDLVKETTGQVVDIEAIDLADPKAFALFCRGETAAILCFRSDGMRELLARLKPDSIHDLIAAYAMCRPGLMALIASYCNRKHGTEEVPKVQETLDRLLAETYGLMIYQEQAMQICNQVGGMDLGAAYRLVTAIKARDTGLIEKCRPMFVVGCQTKGISEQQANELYAMVVKFGEHSFDKCHATHYAIAAFQTAYVKAYFPDQFGTVVREFGL